MLAELNIMEVFALRDECNAILQSNHDWHTKYDMVFSDVIFQRIFELTALNSYPKPDPTIYVHCDPDTTYEEDTRAFVDAVNRWCDNWAHSE